MLIINILIAVCIILLTHILVCLRTLHYYTCFLLLFYYYFLHSNILFLIYFQVKTLNLSNNHFLTIPKGLSEYKNLEVLIMRNNKINNINMGDEINLYKLNELDISTNNLINWTSIKTMTLYYMPNIKKLDLSNNLLHNASQLYLRSNSLSTLKLINCSIQDVSGEFLKGFPNLTELDLSYNRLEEIYKFPSLTKLTIINLEHNFINRIHYDAFMQLIKLDRLILNKNYKLRILNVTSNYLKVLEATSCNIEYINLNETINLRNLLLNSNSLYYVPYLPLVNLTYLDLSKNKISIIEKNRFRKLESLKYLLLSYNRITDVHYDTFGTNFRLIMLDLSYNYINDLIKIKSDSLLILNMTNCEIVTLDSDCLIRMPYLKKLILSENRLSKLPNNLKSDLDVLNLSSCRIVSINNLTFASMKHLRELYLTGNRLSSDIHPSYFHNVMRVYLDDNAWRCDCESRTFKELYDWLEIRKSEDLTCQFPESVEGQTWLKACYNVWYQGHQKNNVLLYCITISSSLFVLLCILLTIKHTNRLKEERERELEQRRREESERIARERREYERRQSYQNAPDPRETEGPPSYTEALLMPKLTSSCNSLDDSRQNISGSKKSLNSVSSRKSTERRLRRKRRRRSRTIEQSSSRENVDSDTESQTENIVKQFSLYKESSI